jgi:hypothetical protein
MICKFWWGSTTDQKKIHWVSWQKLCHTKKKGGMGFRSLKAFNEALLAKQGWRLFTNPDSLVAQVLKAKYYPNCHFLKAKHKNQSSYTSRSIQHASWVLKRGCYWTIGNEESIDPWEDKWLHQRGNVDSWSTKPETSTISKVSDLMEDNSNGWNEQVIHQNFIPSKAQIFLQIPIMDKTQPDMLTWDGTWDGNYTVKA